MKLSVLFGTFNNDATTTTFLPPCQVQIHTSDESKKVVKDMKGEMLDMIKEKPELLPNQVQIMVKNKHAQPNEVSCPTKILVTPFHQI